MKKVLYTAGILIAIGILLITTIANNKTTKATKKSHPNIIYILADDLGYGELGCYGQTKIKTPNIDALASNGMLFLQHYSGSSVCAPSRCSLLTGFHTGHSQIRNNGRVKNQEEGQRPLQRNTFTLASLMKNAGYKTCCIGKWGLGYPGSEGDPLNQGFDHFFGYNCQTHAHNYYPTYLWRNKEKISLDNPAFSSSQKLPKNANIYNKILYKQYTGKEHASDLMGREVLDFIDSNKGNPFFIYYATPIPHVALQIPDKDLKQYKGIFKETPYNGSKGYLPQRHPRATYAAMISHLDRQIGQIVEKLKKEGLYKNTIIIFSSDNGAAVNGGTDIDFFKGVGDLNGHKGTFYEGGIRVPMIACWPGHIQAASKTNHVSTFWDVLPTMAEITRQNKPDCDGISFLPTLTGNTNKQKTHHHLYWELGKSQAVRMGAWKGIRKWKNGTPEKTMLFNLTNDKGEQRDIASLHPEIVLEIEKIMDSRTPSEVKAWNFGM